MLRTTTLSAAALLGLALLAPTQATAAEATCQGRAATVTFVQGPDAGPIICRERRLTVDGGRGNDTMEGTTGRDVLIGGPGRDTADGRERRDVCQAEERTSCEVRR